MYDIQKEFKESEKENKVFEVKNESYQNDIANKLITGGLGSEIKFILNNPIKISRFKIFKFKIKSFIKNIIDVL